jgi:hypothetical protein
VTLPMVHEVQIGGMDEQSAAHAIEAALVATVEENRTTWLLLALIALAGRLGVEEPEGVAECFPTPIRYNGVGNG